MVHSKSQDVHLVQRSNAVTSTPISLKKARKTTATLSKSPLLPIEIESEEASLSSSSLEMESDTAIPLPFSLPMESDEEQLIRTDVIHRQDEKRKRRNSVTFGLL